MKIDDYKFTVDQLRKDKIIYACEACATNLLCIFGYIFSSQYFASPLKDITNVFLLIVAVGYTLYMGIGNANRLMTIKKIEKQI